MQIITPIGFRVSLRAQEFRGFAPRQACMQIITPIGALRVYSAVIGRHNVPYMLAAVATALCTSIPGTQITLAVRAGQMCGQVSGPSVLCAPRAAPDYAHQRGPPTVHPISCCGSSPCSRVPALGHNARHHS